MSLEETILNKIKKGELYVHICEPLATCDRNLAFCPEREECEQLQAYLEVESDVSDLVQHLHCHFCESKDWLLVAVSKKGVMLSMTCSPDFGQEVKKVLDGD